MAEHVHTLKRNLEILERYKAGELLAPLADSYGISRQRVWQIVNKYGEINHNRKNSLYTCHNCSKQFRKPNCQLKSRFSYCSNACYFAKRGAKSLHLTGTEQKRGNRRARRVIAKYFILEPHHAVHHWDRNQLNNEPENLAAFASHADHIAYHHWEDAGSIGQAPSQPIWMK